jgi:hypothetical protein
VTDTDPFLAANCRPVGTAIATVFSAGAKLPLATDSDSVGRRAPTPVSEAWEMLGNPATVHVNAACRRAVPWAVAETATE